MNRFYNPNRGNHATPTVRPHGNINTPHETIKKDRSSTVTKPATIPIDERTKIEIHLVKRITTTYRVTAPRNRRKYNLPLEKNECLGTETEYQVVINYLKLDPGRRTKDGYPEFRNVCPPFKHTLDIATELDCSLWEWVSLNNLMFHEEDIRQKIVELWIREPKKITQGKGNSK